VTESAKAVPRLFDARNTIGALLAIYGVLLTIAGLAPGIPPEHQNTSTDNRVDLYVGTDANWWVGLILIGVAQGFFGWALLRPVRIAEPETGADG
jgi:hypothetical protein